MADETNNKPTPKPLSQKTDAELKRETKARLRRLDPVTASEVVSEVVGSPVAGFVNFLREHAIVGLAVGFVLGTQVQTVVRQFLASFVDPLFQLLIPGNEALSKRYFWVTFNGRGAPFNWGAFVYDLLDFLFVAVMIYAIIKAFSLDKLDKQQ
jgi:large-conductance mechanosensitive channel